MAITFGGLATGIDTESIISALMEIEREPLNRLESEKSYLSSRLEAFSNFEDKLNALSSAIDEMNDPDKLGSFTATAGSDEFFSLTMESSSLASAGSFQLEVVNLAQVQKDVSVGYSETDTAVFSGGTISINGTTDITIAEDSSLNDIRDAINEADDTEDTGVRASIIHDGTHYRMVLTGKDAETAFTATASGISDGTTALSFANTQTAEPAEIIIDGITITSKSNTISNAIPGVLIDLTKENSAGTSTTVSLDTDYEAITTKLDTFVTAYNDINNFIKDQQDADWGHDQNFRSVSNKLQGLLVTNSGSGGAYNFLVDLGFKTDSKTGDISIDSTKLQETLNADYDSVEQLLIGSDGSSGILNQFTTYLDGWTDTFDGLYAGKKQSYDSTIRSFDSSIERMELRLEKREQLLLSQFSAMEQLVSSMNATSSYLTQQMANISSLGGE